MYHLEDIGLGLFVAGGYFVGTYFLVSTIVPSLALSIAYPVSMGALSFFILLVLTRREEKGNLANVFYGLPLILLLCGAISWITRVLGW